MNLGELASLLPDDPASWPEADPCRAFPSALRARLGARLAGMFAAADRARPRAAWRLGVSTRAYEPGDAFKDLSLPLLARLGEYHTRVDHAPGRSLAVIVLHLYGNMTYRGRPGGVNKGQQALALAGLLALIHAGALHGTRVLRCFDADLGAFLLAREDDLRRARWLWVITDGLHSPEAPDGGLSALAQPLSPRANLNSSLLLVRDEDELPSSLLGLLGEARDGGEHVAALRPYLKATTGGAGEAKAASRFSGEGYERSLEAQLEVARAMANERGFGQLLAWPSRPLDTLARELLMLC
jgi:hypothetical protein